jgi:hypothetical protein
MFLTFPRGVITILCVFLAVIQCEAQSIVGKWTRNTIKLFTLDKATGNQVPVSEQTQQQYNEAIEKNGNKEILEMKSNNTYTSTVTTTGAEPRIRNGKYILTGKVLDMNIPLVHDQKTTITIHTLTEKEMVWELKFMGKLTEIIYTRN